MPVINENFVNMIRTLGNLRNSEIEFQRLPTDWENKLLNQIRQGKYEEIKIPPFSDIEAGVGLMSFDEATQFTFFTIKLVTRYSQASIEAGVIPESALELADTLLYLLSYCKEMEDIQSIYQLAPVMFAKEVYRNKHKKNSYHIMKAQNYISSSIYKKITLEEVADHVGLSPTYLCNLFMKETGLSLHNYIQHEKIEVSCNLLQHSTRSVSEISTYMGFQNQSNFSAVFRKWKGMTPSEYRKINYREMY